MPKAPSPIEIELTDDEAAELLTPVGSGGQQAFQQTLIAQLEGNNRTISFDDDEMGKLMRYMTQYGSGGFQGRLRKAFKRPIAELLARK